MKSKNLTTFLAGGIFLFAAAGMNALAAQPEDTASAHEVYAPAGQIVYKIDTLTGDYEIAGDGYYPVWDVMKTENGLYGLTGDTDDTLWDLRVFNETGSDYVSYHVTDMVGECDGKFYFLEDALGPNKELYVYDPATEDTEKAISPEIFDAETDGELLYASVLYIDEEHPEGICRIGFGPDRETGKWSLLRALEDGAEYLPEIVKGEDGVYFLHCSPVREQEEDAASAVQGEDASEMQEEEDIVSVLLYKLEYEEPHQCTVMARFTIPADAVVRLAEVTDAAAVLEYQDASDREVYLLRFADGSALNFGYLAPEDEFPPIFPAGDNFYTVFGDNTICLVDTETNVQEIMTLPVDAKIWDVYENKAVYSLNGGLYLADGEDIREEQGEAEEKEDITEDVTEAEEKEDITEDVTEAEEKEDITENVTEAEEKEDITEDRADVAGNEDETPSPDAREALSKVLLQYIDELQAPSVFFEKVLEDPVTAALLEETKGSFEVSLDLKLDESVDEMPLKAEFCVEKAEEGYRIEGFALFGEDEPANIEFELDTVSGSLKISADGQTETMDLSSLVGMYEKILPALVQKKGSEVFGKEAAALFLGSREISAREDTFTYPKFTEDKKIQKVTEPCTTYEMMIGWDEILNYLHLFAEQMDSLYASVQDFTQQVSGYRPSYDTGLDLEENIESAVAIMQKYSPDGIELCFHVLEDELAGVSIGIRMSENAVSAHAPDGKPVGTQRIGSDAEPAGVLITADLTRKTKQEWTTGQEIIRDLAARLTVRVVNEQGDEVTEYMNMGLTESKITDDYERWNRNGFLYVGTRQFQASHTYTPDQENRPGPSYQLHVSPDILNLGITKGISVFLNEAEEQDDEGTSISVHALSGSEKLIDGTVTIKKLPD